MSVNIPTAYAKKSLTLMLAEKVNEYFKDEQHQKEFEEWHLQKYGIPYVPDLGETDEKDN